MMAGLELRFQRVEGQRLLWQGKLDGQLVRAVLAWTNAAECPVTSSVGASVAIPRSLQVYGNSTLHTLGELSLDEEQAEPAERGIRQREPRLRLRAALSRRGLRNAAAHGRPRATRVVSPRAPLIHN